MAKKESPKEIPQTGLEIMRTATIEEIVKVIGSGHPPVGCINCSLVSCNACWRHWMETGEAHPAPSAGLEKCKRILEIK